MKEVHKAHTSYRKKPVNLTEQDLPLFSHELKKEIRDTHYLTLHHVFLLNDSIFRLSGLKFYTPYTHVLGLRKKERIKRALLLKNKSTSIDKAIWIVDDWSFGYFHWLTDALPRLMAVANLKYPVVLPEYLQKYDFVSASLGILGYETIFVAKEQPLKVKELILPSHTAPSGNYNRVLLQELRTRFLEKLTIQAASKKIYISRKKAPKRHVINEEALQEFLVKEGFEIRYFEDYSLKQQIELMAACKCVIGLHGAGLTNILFMQKGTRLLELRNEGDSHNNCYFSMASDLDLDYYYLLNKGNSSDTHTVDVTVDLNDLKKVLETMKV